MKSGNVWLRFKIHHQLAKIRLLIFENNLDLYGGVDNGKVSSTNSCVFTDHILYILGAIIGVCFLCMKVQHV